MRRGGYFSSLSGDGAATAAHVLRPPRRVFAPEPPPLDLAPPQPRASPPEDAGPPAPRPTDAPHREASQPGRPPAAQGSPARRVAADVERPVSVQRVPAVPPLDASSAPPDDPRVRPIERTAPHPVSKPPHPARPPEPPRIEPLRRVEPARVAARRPAARRDRVPELRIGTIDVTVVPPPTAPVPPAPQQPHAAAVHRPRPVRGPDRPQPWFGLAQR
ncbi:MAG TPA: hypothetical protein VGQ38_06390 [Gaiellaceae bacterium]|nr:hypothetical protein [Gaiellaceae bacterium]